MEEQVTSSPETTPQNNSARFVIPLVLVVLVAGVFIFMNKNEKASSIQTPAPSEAVQVSEVPTAAATVKTFTITGKNFSYTLNEMKVQKGDTVKITFVNSEGFHDLRIDEFNAATTKMAAGKTETIEFVADKVGTFEYYCSVGQHRQNGMKGNLIVE